MEREREVAKALVFKAKQRDLRYFQKYFGIFRAGGWPPWRHFSRYIPKNPVLGTNLERKRKPAHIARAQEEKARHRKKWEIPAQNPLEKEEVEASSSFCHTVQAQRGTALCVTGKAMQKAGAALADG